MIKYDQYKYPYLPHEAESDFEIAIDNHWENQEMKYNHNANIELNQKKQKLYNYTKRRGHSCQ